jgi:uncharacterized protein YjbJ (UPF0337 family)
MDQIAVRCERGFRRHAWGKPRCQAIPEEEDMAKSSRRNQSEGALDRLGGKVMELVGKVTGRRSTQAKGKAARFRGSARSTKGRAKRAVR